MRFLRSRCITRAKKGQLVAALRQRLRAMSPTGEVSSEDEDALQGLEKVSVGALPCQSVGKVDGGVVTLSFGLF